MVGRNDPCPCGSGKKYKKCCQTKLVSAAPDQRRATAPTPFECSQLATLFNAGRFVELESGARRLVQRYPESGFAWTVLGAALQSQGKDALHAVQRAAELLPADAEAQLNLGNALRDRGQTDGALASYRRALQLKADFAVAHYNAGNLFKDLGRLDEAAASYRRALQINPDFADAHCNLGWALLALGRHADAVASYRRLLELRPQDAEAHINLGNAQRDLGRADDALASYRRALEIRSEFAEAHYSLGNALKDLGRLDEAAASYHRALLIKPDFSDAYGSLGGARMAQGRLADALHSYRHQLGLAPGNEEARHLIAALSGHTTERAPVEYVESVFDSYAGTFDTHLQQVLQYDTPAKLVALLTEFAPSPDEKWRVLDLGCGTGLVGLAIAPLARQLVGVDLSAKMLEKARARHLYQRLERMDLAAMLHAEAAANYDVIVAADVFIYLGRLDEAVDEIRRLLCPGGVFAFSIETLEEPSQARVDPAMHPGYRLEHSGRYTHSVDYLARLGNASGFRTKAMAATQLRWENGRAVAGHLVLWQA